MADGGTDGRMFFFTRTRQATSTVGDRYVPPAPGPGTDRETCETRERHVRHTRTVLSAESPLSRHSPPTPLHRRASPEGARERPARCSEDDWQSSSSDLSPALRQRGSSLSLLGRSSSWHCAGELAEPSATSVSLSAALLSPARSAGAAVVATRRCDRKWARPTTPRCRPPGARGGARGRRRRRPPRGWSIGRRGSAAACWMVHRRRPRRGSTASGGEKGQLSG